MIHAVFLVSALADNMMNIVIDIITNMNSADKVERTIKK